MSKTETMTMTPAKEREKAGSVPPGITTFGTELLRIAAIAIVLLHHHLPPGAYLAIFRPEQCFDWPIPPLGRGLEMQPELQYLDLLSFSPLFLISFLNTSVRHDA